MPQHSLTNIQTRYTHAIRIVAIHISRLATFSPVFKMTSIQIPTDTQEKLVIAFTEETTLLKCYYIEEASYKLKVKQRNVGLILASIATIICVFCVIFRKQELFADNQYPTLASFICYIFSVMFLTLSSPTW
jgi:hypothetical protein